MSTWKKAAGLVIAGLFMLVMGLCKTALAGTTDTVLVTVTVNVVSVSVDTTTWAIGQVAPSAVAISNAIPVENDGNVQEDYSLSLDHTGWEIATSSGAAGDKFVLSALFTTTPAASIVDNMFGETDGPDDVIVDGNTPASPTMYARTGEGPDAKGYDVVETLFRDLYLNFRAPTSSVLTTEQSITVTVTAAAG